MAGCSWETDGETPSRSLDLVHGGGKSLNAIRREAAEPRCQSQGKTLLRHLRWGYTQKLSACGRRLGTLLPVGYREQPIAAAGAGDRVGAKPPVLLGKENSCRRATIASRVENFPPRGQPRTQARVRLPWGGGVGTQREATSSPTPCPGCSGCREGRKDAICAVNGLRVSWEDRYASKMKRVCWVGSCGRGRFGVSGQDGGISRSKARPE